MMLLAFLIIFQGLRCSIGADLPMGPGYLGSPPTGFVMNDLLTFTQFTFNVKFRSTGSNMVGFSFRHDPAYFLVTLVTLARNDDPSKTNLLQNPNFASAYTTAAGTRFPTSWSIWYQNGVIPYAAGVLAFGGWFDGAVGSYDGIYQAISNIDIRVNYTLSITLSGTGIISGPRGQIQWGAYAAPCANPFLDIAYCTLPVELGFNNIVVVGSPTPAPITPQPTTPSFIPTLFPSSVLPTSNPTRQPFSQPSASPSNQLSRQPSSQPSRYPTLQPSVQPTRQPSGQPVSQPSKQPFDNPSRQPTAQPSSQPSKQPLNQPSRQPSKQPASKPSTIPTSQPSSQPSRQPTLQPNSLPSTTPSTFPTRQPSKQPSLQPSRNPTMQPSRQPSSQPSNQPSSQPSSDPSSQPSTQPSRQPSSQPSRTPSRQPSRQPTAQPSCNPSNIPTGLPSQQPSRQPSRAPTKQPACRPSTQPSMFPSIAPSSFPSEQPSRIPSRSPSGQPSQDPIALPSKQPSSQPTTIPTTQPLLQPSQQPASQTSSNPTFLTAKPLSKSPVYPSSLPTSETLKNVRSIKSAMQSMSREYLSPYYYAILLLLWVALSYLSLVLYRWLISSNMASAKSLKKVMSAEIVEAQLANDRIVDETSAPDIIINSVASSILCPVSMDYYVAPQIEGGRLPFNQSFQKHHKGSLLLKSHHFGYLFFSFIEMSTTLSKAAASPHNDTNGNTVAAVSRFSTAESLFQPLSSAYRMLMHLLRQVTKIFFVSMIISIIHRYQYPHEYFLGYLGIATTFGFRCDQFVSSRLECESQEESTLFSHYSLCRWQESRPFCVNADYTRSSYVILLLSLFAVMISCPVHMLIDWLMDRIIFVSDYLESNIDYEIYYREILRHLCREGANNAALLVHRESSSVLKEVNSVKGLPSKKILPSPSPSKMLLLNRDFSKAMSQACSSDQFMDIANGFISTKEGESQSQSTEGINFRDFRLLKASSEAFNELSGISFSQLALLGQQKDEQQRSVEHTSEQSYGKLPPISSPYAASGTGKGKLRFKQAVRRVSVANIGISNRQKIVQTQKQLESKAGISAPPIAAGNAGRKKFQAAVRRVSVVNATKRLMSAANEEPGVVPTLAGEQRDMRDSYPSYQQGNLKVAYLTVIDSLESIREKLSSNDKTLLDNQWRKSITEKSGESSYIYDLINKTDTESKLAIQDIRPRRNVPKSDVALVGSSVLWNLSLDLLGRDSPECRAILSRRRSDISVLQTRNTASGWRALSSIIAVTIINSVSIIVTFYMVDDNPLLSMSWRYGWLVSCILYIFLDTLLYETFAVYIVDIFLPEYFTVGVIKKLRKSMVKLLREWLSSSPSSSRISTLPIQPSKTSSFNISSTFMGKSFGSPSSRVAPTNSDSHNKRVVRDTNDEFLEADIESANKARSPLDFVYVSKRIAHFLPSIFESSAAHNYRAHWLSLPELEKHRVIGHNVLKWFIGLRNGVQKRSIQCLHTGSACLAGFVAFLGSDNETVGLVIALCVLVIPVSAFLLLPWIIVRMKGNNTKVTDDSVSEEDSDLNNGEEEAARQLEEDILNMLETMIASINKRKQDAAFESSSKDPQISTTNLISSLLEKEMLRIRALVFQARLSNPISDERASLVINSSLKKFSRKVMDAQRASEAVITSSFGISDREDDTIRKMRVIIENVVRQAVGEGAKGFDHIMDGGGSKKRKGLHSVSNKETIEEILADVLSTLQTTLLNVNSESGVEGLVSSSLDAALNALLIHKLQDIGGDVLFQNYHNQSALSLRMAKQDKANYQANYSAVLDKFAEVKQLSLERCMSLIRSLQKQNGQGKQRFQKAIRRVSMMNNLGRRSDVKETVQEQMDDAVDEEPDFNRLMKGLFKIPDSEDDNAFDSADSSGSSDDYDDEGNLIPHTNRRRRKAKPAAGDDAMIRPDIDVQPAPLKGKDKFRAAVRRVSVANVATKGTTKNRKNRKNRKNGNRMISDEDSNEDNDDAFDSADSSGSSDEEDDDGNNTIQYRKGSRKRGAAKGKGKRAALVSDGEGNTLVKKTLAPIKGKEKFQAAARRISVMNASTKAMKNRPTKAVDKKARKRVPNNSGDEDSNEEEEDDNSYGSAESSGSSDEDVDGETNTTTRRRQQRRRKEKSKRATETGDREVVKPAAIEKDKGGWTEEDPAAVVQSASSRSFNLPPLKGQKLFKSAVRRVSVVNVVKARAMKSAPSSKAIDRTKRRDNAGGSSGEESNENDSYDSAASSGSSDDDGEDVKKSKYKSRNANSHRQDRKKTSKSYDDNNEDDNISYDSRGGNNKDANATEDDENDDDDDASGNSIDVAGDSESDDDDDDDDDDDNELTKEMIAAPKRKNATNRVALSKQLRESF